jgi:hypothetical protein
MNDGDVKTFDVVIEASGQAVGQANTIGHRLKQGDDWVDV